VRAVVHSPGRFPNTRLHGRARRAPEHERPSEALFPPSIVANGGLTRGIVPGPSNPGAPGRGLTLLQAGPNPRRGGAPVRCALSSPQAVVLTVLDAMDALVHRERTARLAAGPHKLRMHSVLPDGREVPSGVCYYRVMAGAEAVSGAWVRIR
jgi:hypothetical protein